MKHVKELETKNSELLQRLQKINQEKLFEKDVRSSYNSGSNDGLNLASSMTSRISLKNDTLENYRRISAPPMNLNATTSVLLSRPTTGDDSKDSKPVPFLPSVSNSKSNLNLNGNSSAADSKNTNTNTNTSVPTKLTILKPETLTMSVTNGKHDTIWHNSLKHIEILASIKQSM